MSPGHFPPRTSPFSKPSQLSVLSHWERYCRPTDRLPLQTAETYRNLYSTPCLNRCCAAELLLLKFFINVYHRKCCVLSFVLQTESIQRLYSFHKIMGFRDHFRIFHCNFWDLSMVDYRFPRIFEQWQPIRS